MTEEEQIARRFSSMLDAHRQMASEEFGNHYGMLVPESQVDESDPVALAIGEAVAEITSKLSEFISHATSQSTVSVGDVAPVYSGTREPPETIPEDRPAIVDEESPAPSPNFQPLPDPAPPEIGGGRTATFDLGEKQVSSSVDPGAFRFDASSSPIDVGSPQPEMRSPIPVLTQMSPPSDPIDLGVEPPRRNRDAGFEAPDQDQAQADFFRSATKQPKVDRGADSASPPYTGAQLQQSEMVIDIGGAIDDFGIEMAEFGNSVADTIRVLTRRLNEASRSIQGEGYDIR